MMLVDVLIEHKDLIWGFSDNKIIVGLRDIRLVQTYLIVASYFWWTCMISKTMESEIDITVIIQNIS